MAIKMIFCLRRRADLSREQFQRYWLDEHAAKVRALSEQTGMLRYVQLHTVDSALGSDAARTRNITGDYDGVMEGWWQSEEQARAAFLAAGPDAGRTLLEDEHRFIDLQRSALFMTREHKIF